MNKSLCLLLTSLIIIFSGFTQEPDPPKWVYRVDMRGPDEIFEQGFAPWGDNRNLMHHATGQSCTMGSMEDANLIYHTSNFISTTSISYLPSSQIGVDAVLRSYARTYCEAGQKFYVYTIRPNQHFYELNFSCSSYLKSERSQGVPYLFSPEGRLLERIMHNDLLISEWDAQGGIDSTLIFSVETFILRFDSSGNLYFGRDNSYSNSRYVSQPSNPNMQAYLKMFPSPDEAQELILPGRARLLTRILRDFFDRQGIAAGFAALPFASGPFRDKRSVDVDNSIDIPPSSVSPHAAWPAIRIKTY